jgi:hypothetical protein
VQRQKEYLNKTNILVKKTKKDFHKACGGGGNDKDERKRNSARR